MATRSKRVSRVKQENSDLYMLDEQEEDDALERAENLLRTKKLQQKGSPAKHKLKQASSDDDEESNEDESYDSSLNNFIADDEEAEAELLEKHKMPSRPKKHRSEHIKQLDEEDLDLIRDNVGIEIKKKNRLKRNIGLDEDRSQQAEEMQIDTRSKPANSTHLKAESERHKTEQESKFKRQRLEIEQEERGAANAKLDPDKYLKAKNIFGDANDQNLQVKSDSKNASAATLKELFNADEIDDPFNTENDIKIAQTDIPERYQVKLENRLDPMPTTDELREEAEWVLERLTSLPDKDNKYGKMVQARDTREKVFKVLKMIYIELFDVPMICKYRKYEFAPELDEDAVWHIFNLDLEFGKFQRNKVLVNDFLQKVQKFDSKIKNYQVELSFAKCQSELNNFNALIRYLRYQFADQLQQQEDDLQFKRKQPQSRDEIQIARANRIHEFSRLCFLESGQFQENLQYRKLTHQPPEPKASPGTVASEFMTKAFADVTELLQAVCRYAAVELAAQPQIRNMMKKQIREHGHITATPTEQGKKDLDIFHQSYRVKLVENLALVHLSCSDLFLDIQQCEKANLITTKIELPPSKQNDFRAFLEECYMDVAQRKESWNGLRSLVIKILVEEILYKEIVKEVRDEIQLEAESFVISNCKRAYTELLMTGPFQTILNSNEQRDQAIPDHSQIKKRSEEIIKPKERLCVMGALMHQIDANNYIVTVAVVDKYGELIAHKDFMRLLPPRIKKQRMQPGQPSFDQDRPKTDEELEHERDRARLIEILEQHSVDLIVVAANSLEARTLKRVMEELALDLKNKKPLTQEEKRNAQQLVAKEAFVIWGSTEVAKLFALSHNSQKLHKGVQQILKQTISLARFEQDPLIEVLNLWSPITAENQALALNLDPMQKLVNQSRLADGLEEVNIRVVNKVGVDLNLVLDHEHMQSVIQFLSGLGPRKAKQLVVSAKQLGKKLSTRGEMLKAKIITFKVYFSVVPFILIRIPEEELGKKQDLKFDILDQTRIHHEHYKLAMKIATDACLRSDGPDDLNQNVEKTEQNRKCKEVIARPQHLKNLDLKAYYQQLEMTSQGNMRIAIDLIIEEFTAPFADPRQQRTPTSLGITDERLFYLLIDESKRTFKRGLIVTATVTNVLETKAICRLENGLNASIIKEKILDKDSQEKLRDILDVGYIITGRIDKILTEDKHKFEVQLNCKKGDLHSHENYLKDLAQSLGLDPKVIKDEDKKNLNFSDDQKPKLQGRFTPRRIAHERFKNISSRRALAELENAEVGEFVFRPSTRSEDAITLTWKFWKKHFVHIDIQELEKLPGSAIGQRLMISNEQFDNLREIVERYIIPCNRLVKEVTLSPKWCDAERWEDLEETLKQEKASDKGRIPYRFAILPQYQQHIVLAYVPREKVIKEFIKVRPKGFYFHEQNLAPFIALVNWFKDQWQTKDYQRYLKRQKSPRTSIKFQVQIKETPTGDQFNDYSGAGHQWQAQGAGSVYSNNQNVQPLTNIKTEHQIKSFGRGARNPPPRDSPRQGGWQDTRVKYEGGRSPAAWTQQRNQYEESKDVYMAESYGQPDRNIGMQRGGYDQDRSRNSNACFKCSQTGHLARDCPNSGDRAGAARGKGCFNCGEEGHISSNCPQPRKERGGDRRQPGGNLECYRCHEMGHVSRDCPNQADDRGGFKRQRGNDGNSLRRNADGGYEISSQGWGNNENDGEQNWGNQNFGNTPRQDFGGWGDNVRQ